MNEFYTFFENNKDNFLEYVESYLFDLKERDSSYKALLDEIEDTLEVYSNVREVIDERQEVSLSKKEVLYLIKALELIEKQKYYEMEIVFFLGIKESIFLFKKLEIL